MLLLEYLDAYGKTWDLRTGEVRMAPGATGLGLLRLTSFLQDRGVRSGQRRVGYKVPPQTIKLPMKFGYPGWSTRSWDDFGEAWWKALRPHIDGTLRITNTTRGTRRSVRVRTEDDGGGAWEYDPSDVTPYDFDWTLTADDPWWKGDQVAVPFGAAEAATPFYGSSGFGPPFYIAAGNSVGQQVVTNPGDVDAWPVITFVGPVTSFVVTNADGSTFSGTPNLVAGQQLIVDTTEDAKSATFVAADGTRTDWTTNLSTWQFRPVPAGSSSAFGVQITGTGSAQVAFRPRYFRPFH